MEVTAAKHNDPDNGDREEAGTQHRTERAGIDAAPSEPAVDRTRPQHFRAMETPDAQAIVTGVCGETMGMYVRLSGKTIQEATFMSDGCTPAVAYANLVTTMVQGMSLDQAKRIKPQDLIVEMRRLLKEHDHCAKLAVLTLQQAIADWEGEGDDAPKQ
jgi:nitrogen fixation NifU-like protein